MNNNIPIYWRPHLPNIESRTDWIVVIVHTNVPEPHTASCLLILLHSFAASGIDQSQPAGRGVAPRHTTSYLLPIGHRLFAILLYTFLLFFGTRACTSCGLIASVIYYYHQHRRRHQLCIILVFLLSFL